MNIPASSLKQKNSFVSINMEFACFIIHIKIVKLILQIILQYRLHTKCIQFPIIQRQSSITLYKLSKLLFYICIWRNICIKYINFPFGFQWNINPPYHVMDITVLQKYIVVLRGLCVQNNMYKVIVIACLSFGNSFSQSLEKQSSLGNVCIFSLKCTKWPAQPT